MNKVVLDASALLALLNAEPGFETVQEALPQAMISSVNLAEVSTRLTLIGMPEDQMREALALLGLEVRIFDEEMAVQAGLLAGQTRQAGLSLGDRACLALAQSSGSPVITADRAWKTLHLPIEIHLIR